MEMVTKQYFNKKTKFICLYNKSFTLFNYFWYQHRSKNLFCTGAFNNSYIKNGNLKT